MIPIEDFAALDADIGAALNGTVSLLLVFDRWAEGMKKPERQELARYIAERVHDALLARAEG